MWFGSFEGLNVHNGREITTFRPSQNNKGLTQNEIYSIYGNRKGAIYLRAGHDLVKYDVLTQEFICLAQKEINGIYYANDTLWVLSDHTVFIIWKEKRDYINFVISIRNSEMETVFFRMENICGSERRTICFRFL